MARREFRSFVRSRVLLSPLAGDENATAAATTAEVESAPPPEPVTASRLAKQSAALEWMVVVGLIGICMTVAIIIAMRLAKPRRGKPLRGVTRLTSAWKESGRRLKVDTTGAPDDLEGLR